MAPDSNGDGDSHDDHRSMTGVDTSAAEAALKAKLSRKRTKSGCLTCRKRRIKCGEERPVCKNCIKSKRHCEGYSQRVVFKAPAFDFRPAPHGGAHITFQAGPVPGPAAAYHTEYIHPGIDHSVHSQLRPRPVEQNAPNAPVYHHPPHHPVLPNQTIQHFEQYPVQAQHFAPVRPAHDLGPHQPQPFLPSNVPAQAPSVPSEFAQQPFQGYNSHMLDVNGTAVSMMPNVSGLNSQTSMVNGHAFAPAVQPMPRPQADGTWHNVRQDTSIAPEVRLSSAMQIVPSTSAPAPVAAATTNGNGQSWTTVSYVPRPELSRPIDYRPTPVPPTQAAFSEPQVSMAPIPQISTHTTPDFYEYEAHVPLSDSPTYILNQAAVESHDDDYYDVNFDEEMDIDTGALAAMDYDRQRTLSRILHGNHITIQELQTRRYDTFLYDGMLEKYHVEEHANPLRNPATARVFAHFISVTGPSLSIFERHPRNTSVLFTEGHIPFSQQGLWTYTMPMAALHHQGLLHAMLALASLHIARLKGASQTPSMQHYAWALKRVHHSVGHPKKRLKLTTIAASMLLGFYEIMTADHMKWNMHLAGSKQLFVEIDFVRMTRQFRRMKIDKHARQQLGNRRQSVPHLGFSQDELLDQIPDVDERIISDLVGREVRYSDHGEIMTPLSGIPQELDLGRHEMLRDLYWWYCKQDAYQSIVSGNPLLMDFSRWANCPPRAPLGKGDAVYGSFDHLILLLGRIAEFSSRDRARKLKQMELNGGQWRPAPGTNMPRPPPPPPNGAPPTPVSAGAPPTPVPPPAPPMFYGMAPPPRQNVQMPSSYMPAPNAPHMPSPPHATFNDPVDLQAATQTALKEYGEIRAALLRFKSSLGDHFQPLTPEYQTPMDTPFGTALFYRSYDIGCLWAVYNMAEIIAIRSHPHMPPAAHMAAAIAAPQTAHQANEIGRIAAGIVPGSADQDLNPALGAALCESCMPCFFAAVQYQDPHQRHATVMRIFGIAQRTGWGTAELIANGCETSWVKAADAGRGPPYQRVVRNQQSDDPRLNGSWERLDPNAMPDEQNEADRRLIKTKADARLNWAIGIMGTEDDIKAMG